MEVEKEAAKTAAMKERGADPYDLKQQVKNLLTYKTLSFLVFLVVLLLVRSSFPPKILT